MQHTRLVLDIEVIDQVDSGYNHQPSDRLLPGLF
jgi:hypothetical protein